MSQSRDRFRERFENIRKRLFDFSPKNPLLNFKFPAKTTIRIVDGRSDLIYSKLREGDNRLEIRDVYKRQKEEGFNLQETRVIDEWMRSDKHRVHLLSPLPVKQIEETLANLSKTAKSLMAESGVNTLYIVFGFLEWCRPSAPDTPQSAPILMASIDLRREKLDARTGSTIYSIAFTEGDVDVNPMLREYLEREHHPLKLPKLSIDDTPERYLGNLRESLRPIPGLQVQNQVTLGLFSVTSMLLYRDLDSNENPSLLSHSFIQHLLEGATNKEALEHSEYSIDDPRLDRDPPPLVYDADSSQHSALIEAMRGKNLVIEGPPGTGKSQTITNLIAAALSQGKSILFVSEKKAALDVVHKRLAQCGLAPFCLELHSHKTKMGDLVESLRLREKTTANAARDSLIDKKTFLNSNKALLNIYTNTINSNYGKCGQTIYDIIWLREKLRNNLSFTPLLLDPIPLINADELSYEQVERLKQSAEIYGQHLSQMLDGRSLKQHPWHGVSNWQIDTATERQIALALQSIANFASRLHKQIKDLNAISGQEFLIGEASVINLIRNSKEALPVIPLTLMAELAPKLLDRKAREQLSSLIEAIELHRQIHNKITHLFSKRPDVNADEFPALRACCLALQGMEIDWMTPEELLDFCEKIDGEAAAISLISPWFRQVCLYLNCQLPFSIQNLTLIDKMVNIFDEFPWQAIDLRAPEFENEELLPVASQAYKEIERLQKLESNISLRLDLSVRPNREQLVRYVEALANGGVFSFTPGDFIRARRAWKRMDIRNRKISHLEMARDFREVLQLGDQQLQFQSNRHYQRALGNLYNGLQTPISHILTLSAWYPAVIRKLGFSSDTGKQIMNCLFGISVNNLRALDGFLRTEPANRRVVRELCRNYPKFLKTLPPDLHQASQQDLDSFASQLLKLSAHIKQVVQFIEECHVMPGTPICEIRDALDDIKQIIALQNRIVEDHGTAKLLNRDFSSATELDTTAVRSTLDFIDSIEHSMLPASIVRWMMTSDIRARTSSIRNRLEELETNYNQFIFSKETFTHLTQINDVEGFFYDVGAPGGSFKQIVDKANRAIHSMADLSPWLSYLRSRQELIELGLEPLVRLAEQGDVPAMETLPSASYIYQNALLLNAFKANSRLSTFDGITHNKVRDNFAKLDAEIIASHSSLIVRKLLQMKAPQGKLALAGDDATSNELKSVRGQKVGDFTDMALIRHLLLHPKARVKIREVVDRAAGALQTLKPCFMMSPLSVAQYLPLNVSFDLLVIDEASQLKLEESLGAIARASQVVVVGDLKQLSPSNFFQKKLAGDDEEMEDDSRSIGGESILERAGAIYHPTRMLTWHYRSRHQDLINFSNDHFYVNQLVVFPSPFRGNAESGVQLVLVSKATYENQENPTEAKEVVESAIQHLKNYPDASLGVIAMNLKQKELIEQLFEKGLKDNPNVREIMERLENRGEEVFIKNLENVQGDERDAIFISLNIGRDKDGDIPLNRLGLLNRDGGDRRLNVLTTRAKNRMFVYSSFSPEDLRVSSNSKPGAQLLKEYLIYAQKVSDKNKFGEHKSQQAKNDFQEVLCYELRKHNYETTPQLGSGNFWIDVAVHHPDDNNRYILGIESDGALYHSLGSARDRDRLRQVMLKSLGWNLHQIWSAEWFRNKDREIVRIINRIEQIRRTEEEKLNHRK